jgi:L-fuconolactonase
MQRIDAHQHFWQYDAQKHAWITDEMQAIARDFLPANLQPILKQYNFDGCICVQAEQNQKETAFLLDLANENPFIKGVVGWVDLKADDIDEQLAHYSLFKKLKGFRHMLQDETDRRYMLTDDFKHGISTLKKYNYTYDILIRNDQIKYATELVAAFPDQPFVVDHLAKPDVKNKKIDEWAKDIKALAKNENVACKVSGMVTEADWRHWQASDLTPYLDVVFEAFGIDRVMFGSDWPVCLVAGSYADMIAVPKQYVSKLSANEQAKFWGGNAAKFYQL